MSVEGGARRKVEQFGRLAALGGVLLGADSAVAQKIRSQESRIATISSDISATLQKSDTVTFSQYVNTLAPAAFTVTPKKSNLKLQVEGRNYTLSSDIPGLVSVYDKHERVICGGTFIRDSLSNNGAFLVTANHCFDNNEQIAGYARIEKSDLAVKWVGNYTGPALFLSPHVTSKNISGLIGCVVGGEEKTTPHGIPCGLLAASSENLVSSFEKEYQKARVTDANTRSTATEGIFSVIPNNFSEVKKGAKEIFRGYSGSILVACSDTVCVPAGVTSGFVSKSDDPTLKLEGTAVFSSGPEQLRDAFKKVRTTMNK